MSSWFDRFCFFASKAPLRHISSCKPLCKSEHFFQFLCCRFQTLKIICFTFSNSSENIAILCTLLSKAIRFLPVNFLFDSKTLIVLLESLFSSLSVNLNWNDCNWESKISVYLKSGYLSFALENTLKKELVIENVRAICWIVPNTYLLLLDQAILIHFRSSIDRPLNLPQYPCSNNYFSIPEENI